MQIVPVCPYSFGANTYIIESGGSAFVVDPAVSVDAIIGAAEGLSAEICGILLTHGHFDHTVSVDTVRQRLGVPLYIHEDDAPMLTNGKINGYFDFYGKECVHGAADALLHDGDRILVGSEALTVLNTKGHSRGSVCFVSDGFAVTGDTLFADSIGRCDLYGGSIEQMRASLSRLRSLDRELKIYAGHGTSSTLGRALDNAAYYI